MALDIKRFVESGLETAFTQLENVVEKLTMILPSDGEGYDVETGEIVAKENSEVVMGIFLGTKEKMPQLSGGGTDFNEESVRVGDLKVLVKASDINFEVSDDLEVVRDFDKTRWKVMDFMLDPTKSMYTFDLRAVV